MPSNIRKSRFGKNCIKEPSGPPCPPTPYLGICRCVPLACSSFEHRLSMVTRHVILADVTNRRDAYLSDGPLPKWLQSDYVPSGSRVHCAGAKLLVAASGTMLQNFLDLRLQQASPLSRHSQLPQNPGLTTTNTHHTESYQK